MKKKKKKKKGTGGGVIRVKRGERIAEWLTTPHREPRVDQPEYSMYSTRALEICEGQLLNTCGNDRHKSRVHI